MEKKDKTLNVPHLRFPEFTGEWEKCTLGSIGETFNGLTGKSAVDFGSGSPYITYKSIFDSSKIDISKVEYVKITETERVKQTQNEVEYGDIFFTTSSETPEEVGMASVLLSEIRDCYLNSFCFGYRLFDKCIHQPDFFRFYLRSSNLRKKIAILAQGSTRFNISKNEVMKMPIFLPSLAEQRKISKLLSLIEDRIETQKKIIEDLKKLKAAINNSLHNSIDEYQRFSFNELGNDYSGLTGKSSDDFGSGLPYISYLNVFRNDIVNDGPFDSVNVSKTEKQNLVYYGDLLFTLSSETPSEVGIGAIYLGNTNPIYLNSFCFGVHMLNHENIYGPYLAYFVTSRYFRRAILPFAQGSTRYNLMKSDFMKHKFCFPNMATQKAIYNALHTLSEKIQNEEVCLNKYIEQKQYLLARLFI